MYKLIHRVSRLRDATMYRMRLLQIRPEPDLPDLGTEIRPEPWPDLDRIWWTCFRITQNTPDGTNGVNNAVNCYKSQYSLESPALSVINLYVYVTAALTLITQNCWQVRPIIISLRVLEIINYWTHCSCIGIRYIRLGIWPDFLERPRSLLRWPKVIINAEALRGGLLPSPSALNTRLDKQVDW